ncbi:MAG: alpha/beta hydrolase [Pedobacter sp.]|nr:MAG: alpha/beta hydrolase [Pedobacter sp.]
MIMITIFNRLFLVAAFVFSFSINGFAQKNELPQQNVFYYPDSNAVTNVYQKSQCRLDIYIPKDAKNFATVLWYHGGGITGGRKELPKELLDKGFAVIGVGYRLSPKAKAPAYIEDAAASIAWAFKNIEKYGGDKRLIFVSGHSAGGYLGMMAVMDKSYLSKYQIDANAVAGLIPFSGQCITHFTVRQEQGIKETRPTVDKYAPLYHVRADLPPMLLITGDREMELLGRYEENAYLNRMMKLNGNKTTRLFELQGFDHGGMAQPAFPLLVKEINRLKAVILAQK